MARPQDLIGRIRRLEEQLRQVRTRRTVWDLPYVFDDADFTSQVISSTLYGWQTSGLSGLPLRLHRYGGLLSLTGTFKRLWTADGSTPGGYSAQINEILNVSWPDDAPDAPWPFRTQAPHLFRVPIHYDVNASQEDQSPAYVGQLYLSPGSLRLEIALEHVDYSLVGADSQVPKRRTVYFMVAVTVPFTPPPS